ncbi:hypothetical protein A6395_13265 [Exiguobacterium sp. SH31]|uniref:hypothetical protein n=1 Tax=Exiguobacterium sp. SH31 TaxID=1843183 RepID=UPI0008AD180D|nr:hypothetical protein [Exiguobacterium sp. SH31]OGX78225.1 hypothetical protein A6395_13265 [Exiguobacterium sp. SH31]
MAKTVYFYRLRMFNFEDDTRREISIERSRTELQRFIRTRPQEREFLEDEVAAGAVEELEGQDLGNPEYRTNPIHVFENRAENGEVFWEVIQQDERYIFGLLGKNLDTYLQLRNRRTRRSREIVRREDEQIEATTFFVLDLNTMICAFFREQGAPMIEEMNKLLYRVRGFENFEINMNAMTNQAVIESIARKEVIATLEYEIEVPQDSFFQYVNLRREEVEKIQNQGQTKLVVKLASNGRNTSLLQGVDYEEKVGFLTSLANILRGRQNAKAYVGAKDAGGSKQEYSFLDDHINLKRICNIDYQEVLQLQRANPERAYSDILFEYFRTRLVEVLQEI